VARAGDPDTEAAIAGPADGLDHLVAARGALDRRRPAGLVPRPVPPLGRHHGKTMGVLELGSDAPPEGWQSG
jgi:hypothetical protein